ncbi:HNH endonuclease signature motif containing protein, partial [Streptomyces caeruleatus]
DGTLSLSRNLRLQIYIRDKQECFYCRTRLYISDFTIDHIIPVSNDGKSIWTNMVVSCVDCNKDKANKSLEEFRPNDFQLLKNKLGFLIKTKRKT